MPVPAISCIGVVGLGKMGLPIARHLKRRGFSVVGYDKNPKAVQQAVDAGCIRAGSCAEVAGQSELLIIVVGFESQVDDSLFGPSGIMAGITGPLIVTIASTVAPSYVRSLPARVNGKPITFLDTPLTRAEQAAEAGTLLILGGGDKEAFDRCRPAFETFASDVAYLGGLGAGQVGKMINNLVLWACTSVNYEGLRFAQKLGVDPEALRDVLGKSTAQNWAMSSRSDERSAPWAEKDMMIVLKEADIARVSMPLAGVVKEVIKGFKIDHGYPMLSEDT
jgi:3-hydroxyisobutyrate dehydrogenase-like beta-hydroxyacid dehydrogenase